MLPRFLANKQAFWGWSARAALMSCRFDSAGGLAAPVSALTSGSASVGGGKSDRRVTLATIKEEALGTNSTNAWVQVGALRFLPISSSSGTFLAGIGLPLRGPIVYADEAAVRHHLSVSFSFMQLPLCILIHKRIWSHDCCIDGIVWQRDRACLHTAPAFSDSVRSWTLKSYCVLHARRLCARSHL